MKKKGDTINNSLSDFKDWPDSFNNMIYESGEFGTTEGVSVRDNATVNVSVELANYRIEQGYKASISPIEKGYPLDSMYEWYLQQVASADEVELFTINKAKRDDLRLQVANASITKEEADVIEW